MTITVGHVLIAVALLDLILVPIVVRSAQRSSARATVERPGGAHFVIGVTVVTSIVLVLIGLFLPAVQIPILDLSE